MKKKKNGVDMKLSATVALQSNKCSRVKTTMLILLSAILVGCGTIGAHAPLLTVNQSELPPLHNNLVVANVYLSPAGNALRHLTVKNVQSNTVHSHPFFDNPIMGSKRLEFDRIKLGDEEITRHVVFLDLPQGSYQVTTVGVGYEWGNSVVFRFDEIDNLSFEVSSDSPTFLGGLYVVLSDDLTPKSIRTRRAVAFNASAPDDYGLKKIVERYPAIKDLNFAFGKIIVK